MKQSKILIISIFLFFSILNILIKYLNISQYSINNSEIFNRPSKIQNENIPIPIKKFNENILEVQAQSIDKITNIYQQIENYPLFNKENQNLLSDILSYMDPEKRKDHFQQSILNTSENIQLALKIFTLNYPNNELTNKFLMTRTMAGKILILSNQISIQDCKDIIHNLSNQFKNSFSERIRFNILIDISIATQKCLDIEPNENIEELYEPHSPKILINQSKLVYAQFKKGDSL